MHVVLLDVGNADASNNNASDDALLLSQEAMSLQLAMEKPTGSSYASELPQEVLVIVMSFGQVGRVCKSWSLAMSTRAFYNPTAVALSMMA